MKNIKEEALKFATKAHSGQFRKFVKVPYITHPIAVAEIAVKISGEELNKDLLFAAALLHDVVEDTEVSLDEIGQKFGLWTKTIVGNLTKLTGETYLDSVLRAKNCPYSRIIKIADNTHNMSDLPESLRKEKYRLSKYILEN